MARPRTEINYDQLDKLLGLQCTLRECAFYFKCSEDTIERAVKKDKKMTFNEYREIKRQSGLISLRRIQFHLAERSVPMAIFLGKNYLGQSDKGELQITTTSSPREFVKEKSVEELKYILGETDDDEDED